MTRILVTGGAGFIGLALADKLAQNPTNQIIVSDNLSRGQQDEAFKELTSKDNVTFIECDLCSEAETRQLLAAQFDYIYHMAAVVGVKTVNERPDEVLRVNLQTTLNLFNQLKDNKGIKRLLLASTSEVYAGTLRHFGMEVPTPETTPICIDDISAPRTSYALSKIAAEAIAYSHATVSHLPVTIVRYHNVYGPRMGFLHVIPELIYKLSKEPEVTIASPEHTRAFCYIEDAVNATIACTQSDNTINKTYNIGNSHEETPVMFLAEKIAQATGFKGKLLKGAVTAGSPARRCPDTSKLESDTGFSPAISLNEGIALTYQWYKNKLDSRHE